jgi:outer membrane protein assembly factor BamB
MKIQKKRLSTTIAFALTLLLAATLITALPLTFGQTFEDRMQFQTLVVYDTLGVNQEQVVRIVMLPRPVVTDRYYNVSLTVTKPDGTNDFFNITTNTRAEYDWYYVCTLTGSYSILLSWPGDETHPGTITRTASWTVQTEAVPAAKKVKLYAYVALNPLIVGKGQQLFIGSWVTPPRVVNSGIYYDFTYTITKPDGTTETLVRDSGTPATDGFMYIPDQTGTWTVKMVYPGDVLHESATSSLATFTVTEEPQVAWGEQVGPYSPVPLPTGPWTYPISGEYREWYQISGSWKQVGYDSSSNEWNPYSKGPRSSHILWKMPSLKKNDMGGLFGGEIGHLSMNKGTGNSFVSAWGRLWMTQPVDSGIPGQVHPRLYCFDQYTGELIFQRDLPGNGTGSSIVIAMDADLKLDNKITGSTGPMYTLFIYGGSTWMVRPQTGDVDWYWDGMSPSAFSENYLYYNNYPVRGNYSKISCPYLASYSQIKIVYTHEGSVPRYIWHDIGVSAESGRGNYPRGIGITTYNMTNGETIVVGPDTGIIEAGFASVCADGKYFIQSSFDRSVYALSLYTGEVVWKSEEPWDDPWGCYGSYDYSAGLGCVMMGSYDGHLYAYDTETGALKWKVFTGNTTETAMGTYGAWGMPVIGSDMVYFGTSEHSMTNPSTRGNKLFGVDGESGEIIWSLPFIGFTRGGGIASGMMWYANDYDSCVYMFGKGPTATTVSAPTTAVPLGNAVLIQGTVTDQSSGAKDTPCISDEDMDAWMPYLYQQAQMPTDATGVPVTLQAMRSDGTVIDIAHVTSDIMGHYEYLWTPPDEDTYKILATFEGSESYWMSAAQTALGVTAAPSPAGPIEPEPAEAPLITTEIAIIAAVAVVAVIGVVAYWYLRRRK